MKYEELKDRLLEKENHLRGQTKEERENLKQLLIQDGKITTPLIVNKDFKLLDGHHRLELISEVVKENPSFDTHIPYEIKIFNSEKEEIRYIYQLQIGRRNLTDEDITYYVNLLMTGDGISANKAYQEVANITGKSKSSIQRIHKPELAEVERQRQRDKNLPKLGKSNNNIDEIFNTSYNEETNITEEEMRKSSPEKLRELTKVNPVAEFLLEEDEIVWGRKEEEEVKLNASPIPKEYSEEEYEALSDSAKRRIAFRENLKNKRKKEKKRQEILNPTQLDKQTEKFNNDIMIEEREIRKVGHYFAYKNEVVPSTVMLDDKKTVVNVLDALQLALGSLLINNKVAGEAEVKEFSNLFNLYQTKLEVLEKNV